MTSWGSKAFEWFLIAVRWYIVAWVLCVGFWLLLSLVAAIALLYIFSIESPEWRLFEGRALLLPMVCTAFVCWLMAPQHRHPKAVLLALALLITIGATNIRYFSVERGLGMLGAIAAYLAFRFERRWLAQTLALALGAMLVGCEARAWFDASTVGRRVIDRCDAKGGLVVMTFRSRSLFCIDP